MKYLVAIHHRDDYDAFVVENEQVNRDIDDLNHEMEAAGVRIFAGGLHHVRSAKSVRTLPNGEVIVTDGPYLETTEHVGGFWMLEAPDIDEALVTGSPKIVHFC